MRSAHAHTFIIIISIAVVCGVCGAVAQLASGRGHHLVTTTCPPAPPPFPFPIRLLASSSPRLLPSRLLSMAERPVTVCSHLHMSPNVCVAVLTMRCCRHVATSFANWSRYKSPRESEVTTSQPPAGHPKRNRMRMRMWSGRCREACHQLLPLRGPTPPAYY